MIQVRRLALMGLVNLMSVVSYEWVVNAQSLKPQIQLRTEPPQEKLVSFTADATTPPQPVQLTLQARSKDGKALENARFHITLLTPVTNPWLPTDFPWVEGRTLLDFAAEAPEGQIQFQQMLPIRGEYQLQVRVTPLVEQGFAPFEQTLILPVAEAAIKHQNFVTLAGILLMLGLAGGLVMGGKQQPQPGEIAPQRVQLLLSGAAVVAIAALLMINISAEFAESHGPNHAHAAQASPDAIRSAGLRLKLVGDAHAQVGSLAQFTAEVIDEKTQQPVPNAPLAITAKPLEEEWTAFAYQATTDSSGRLTWQQQFFDGTTHQLTVQLSPANKAAQQFKPFSLTKKVEVDGLVPPLKPRLLALGYMVGILLLGLGLGLWLRDRWGRDLKLATRS